MVLAGVSKFIRFTFRVIQIHSLNVVIHTAESLFTGEMAVATGTLPTEPLQKWICCYHANWHRRISRVAEKMAERTGQSPWSYLQTSLRGIMQRCERSWWRIWNHEGCVQDRLRRLQPFPRRRLPRWLLGNASRLNRVCEESGRMVEDSGLQLPCMPESCG